MGARKDIGELALFAIASAAGVYGLGRGLEGFFTPGRGGINVAWLVLAAAAFIVLCGQMGRVHDTWPRRRAAGGRAPRSRRGAASARRLPGAGDGQSQDGKGS